MISCITCKISACTFAGDTGDTCADRPNIVGARCEGMQLVHQHGFVACLWKGNIDGARHVAAAQALPWLSFAPCKPTRAPCVHHLLALALHSAQHLVHAPDRSILNAHIPLTVMRRLRRRSRAKLCCL